MAIFEIELLVKLKTVDSIALTAKNTLQKDMGYQGTLLDIRREEYYLIEVESKSIEEAKKLGSEFATVTKTIVNPNKHTYTLRVIEGMVNDKEQRASRTESGIEKSAEAAGEKSPFVIAVLVCYKQDEKAQILKDTLKNTLGYGNSVRSVSRGMLWKLIINARTGVRAKEIAEEIASARSMEKGLLANPNSQTYVVL